MFKKLFASVALVAALSSGAFAGDGVLDVVAPFEIKGADPSLSGHIFMKMDIAETLVDADTIGRLHAGLATSWSASDDGLTWRFELRQGVTFHDGSPLTAEAAAQALTFAHGKAGLLAKAPITAISADGNAVVFSLSAPFAALPAFLAEYPFHV